MARLGLRAAEGVAEGGGLGKMPVFRLSAPFGDILLELEATSAVTTTDDAAPERPILPDGMRVDGCWLHTTLIECDIGEVFTVALRLQPRNGWVASYASGEWLDAFELGSQNDGVAAVGMRDPEWLCQRFALVSLDASSPAGNQALRATYKSLSKTRIEIQTAHAWTNHPKTDQEANSPWFAVDLAMTS